MGHVVSGATIKLSEEVDAGRQAGLSWPTTVSALPTSQVNGTPNVSLHLLASTPHD